MRSIMTLNHAFMAGCHTAFVWRKSAAPASETAAPSALRGTRGDAAAVGASAAGSESQYATSTHAADPTSV